MNGRNSVYNSTYLLTLVTMISYSSELFYDITSIENALSVLVMDDYKGPRGLALRELFGLWLNVTNDALTDDTEIDLGQLTLAETVGAAINECEALLLAPSSSAQDLLNVMRICQELNAGRY